MTGEFALQAERELPEIRGHGRLLRHASGAEVLSLRLDDPNRVFAIAFRTLPADSTGIAHVLEHCVLCGSRRYPIRKPFVELMKGSLQTYLNAVTMPDTTVYPVASPNETDFRNLMDVYLDAMFAPLLTPETFLQEAWRLEPDPEGRPSFQGVVYNEMKGYVSSPLGVLSEATRRELFPDTVYGHGYGGDWSAIPDLTHEALLAFHQRYYAPANALVVLTGPDDPTWELEVLAQKFDALPNGTLAPAVAEQPAFAAPRVVRASYPGTRGARRRDGFLALAWALGAGPDLDERLAWQVLDRLLVGSLTSPLRRALVESGIAEDMLSGGYAEGGLQPTFRVAFSGLDPSAVDDAQAVALDALAGAAESLDAAEIEPAINSVEFALREGAVGPVPAGIQHMHRALPSWRHGDDPLAALNFSDALLRLRQRLIGGEPVLQRMIAGLIRSPHRVTVVLEADPGRATRDAVVERRRAEQVGDAREGRERAIDLRGTQAESPEALAAIPLLRRTDLPERLPHDPVEARRTGVHLWLAQPLATQGVVHVDLGLDIADLPPAQAAAARLLGAALLATGTARRDHVALGRWIGRATGGIATEPWAATCRNGSTAARLFLRGKALAERAGELCEILSEILLTARLDDVARLREVVLREKARLEARLVPAGHEFVDLRLRAGFGPAGPLAEATAGVTYLEYLRDAATALDERPETLTAELASLRDHLRGRALVCNVTADPASQSATEPHVARLLDTLEGSTPTVPAAQDATVPLSRTEAIEVPAQVNFVGLGGDLHAAGLTPSGVTEAAARHLANAWLWDQVRVEGGAYGALCRFDAMSGVVTMLSYRDPHVLRTLGTYRAAAAHLRAGPSPRDVDAAVIATVGAQDRPLPAGPRGFAALRRYLCGEDEAWRNARRSELLGATAADFADVGAALEEVATRVVVLGGAEALDRVEVARPKWLSRTRLT
ncbi:insulinase family protein [Rhodobacteraceae bacterium MCCB 386]|nr:insulinase family protein [Roseitranquillus sediminis]